MKGRILAVDDEAGIISFIRDYFESEGYEVITASNGREALEKAGRHPDIILLDIMLPDMSGMEVCRSIRERVGCPIIFLTARVEEEDKIKGFASGADDYVVKPFSVDELGARVNAHLRREKRRMLQVEQRSFGRLTVNYSGRIVYYDNQEIPFARKEYDIIELLSINAGQVFSRERIYELVWGYDAQGDDTSVTEHIKRIRLKISQYTDRTFIETVWGVGYKWSKGF